jgi:hypothetical protein
MMTSAKTTLILKSLGGNTAAVLVRLKALAPYALMELVLPGGSVMALLLWLYRRRRNGTGFGQFPGRLVAFHRWAERLRSNPTVCAAQSEAALG